ncbi:hypothetical protein C2S53_001087 [Perilla frutescens var. hirtella]|uniref:Ubiquitin-like protease family profile domain-containing protein n=1 Tax=Perilla frutescens var. hirtella TaxID=608512 RepID=A0AAD4NY06_PERFH|nr:hypothetical protein C2S53_001087 [Perilla frutescens var. hirtella]
MLFLTLGTKCQRASIGGIDESMKYTTLSQRTSHILFITPIRDITPLSQPTTLVKLDFREVRRRAASAALHSPFLLNDKRFADWKKFLQSNKYRNVRLGYSMKAKFFTDLLKKQQFTDAHINAYMCILHSNSAFAAIIQHVMDIVLTSTGFLEGIRKVFEQYHLFEGASQLNKEIEEIISDEDLLGLSEYVSGHLPGWQPLKPWYDYNKLVFVAHLDSHWVTCFVSFSDHLIILYDSTWHNWAKQIKQSRHNWAKQIRQSRINYFTPLTHILPQLLKYCGFWDCRQDLQAKYTHWKIKTVKGDGIYKQTDGVSCGVYELKFVEMLMSNSRMPQPTDNELEAYRSHVAYTIFRFSTDENTLVSQ